MAPEGGSTVELTFDTCRDDNVEQMRVLNRAIFPINYTERMYKEILACGDVSQLAFHDGSLIGAIGCRLENSPQGVKMYIMTLGVLPPYRDCGIGSRLLQRSLAVLEELPEVVEAYLHVQSSNEDAIRFYQRFGFEVGGLIENYYKRIDPPHAVMLFKALRRGEHSGEGGCGGGGGESSSGHGQGGGLPAQ